MCHATETPNWGCHPNKIGYDGSPLGASGLNGITLALSGLLGFSHLITQNQTQKLVKELLICGVTLPTLLKRKVFH